MDKIFINYFQTRPTSGPRQGVVLNELNTYLYELINDSCKDALPQVQ